VAKPFSHLAQSFHLQHTRMELMYVTLADGHWVTTIINRYIKAQFSHESEYILLNLITAI